MPFFVKTETFKSETTLMKKIKRKHHLASHLEWVKNLIHEGVAISSGYLVNEKGEPGGGGLLVLEAKSFHEAKKIIEKDPLIVEGLVNWNLQEWIPVSGKLVR